VAVTGWLFGAAGNRLPQVRTAGYLGLQCLRGRSQGVGFQDAQTFWALEPLASSDSAGISASHVDSRGEISSVRGIGSTSTVGVHRRSNRAIEVKNSRGF
jgi:hypothetical protein